jgi:hypothetical protein
MDRRHRWSFPQEDFPSSLLDELVSLFKTASQQTFNAMCATARKHKRSCSPELCLSSGRESGPRRVEIPSFSSSCSTLARCLHQGLRYGYVRVDSDEIYFVLVRQYSGEGRKALQLLFVSLAWVTVEQRDRDLQSTASTGHSISCRTLQKFYLIALGPQYSPDAPPHGRLKSFSTAVIRMLRGRRSRPLESSGPCGNQDRREMEQLTIDGNDDGSLIFEAEVEVVVIDVVDGFGGEACLFWVWKVSKRIFIVGSPTKQHSRIAASMPLFRIRQRIKVRLVLKST